MKMAEFLEGYDKQACLMDDTLVHGSNRSDHKEHLFPILKRLQDKGLTLNPEKCTFYQQDVTFLGHRLNAEGISADPKKTQAIQDMQPPRNVHEVRSFLGMVNHLAKFLPDLAAKTKALRDLLRADSTWVWSELQQDAFNHIKQDLTQAPVLTFYDPQKRQIVSADSSSYGLGAVLLQDDGNGCCLPVAYASRALTDTEQLYAQVEKEALAATWACSRFRTYLVGLTFLIQTDHRPLVSLLSQKRLDELTPRMQRFRMRLMEFSYSVQYVPGKEIYTADVLSRAPISAPEHDELEFQAFVQEFEILAIQQLPCTDKRLVEIREAQLADKACRQVREFIATKWPSMQSLSADLRPYAEVADELSVTQDLLLRGSRLVIPLPLREEMLQRLHEGHLGVTRCRSKALQSVWWPSLNKEIASYVQSCPTCCKHRSTGREPLIQTQLPTRPWQTVGMDLLQEIGRTYLVIVDYFSRFFELELLTSTTSRAVVDVLKPIFARHGVPEIVRSDNGPQFSSGEFSLFASDYGFSHITSSPLYPQSNGAAERTVQTAKQLIKKSGDLNKGLLAYRSTPRIGGWSPAQLLYGRQLRTSVPMMPKQLQPKWPNLQQFRKLDEEEKGRQARSYNSRHRAREKPALTPGVGVWIRGGVAPRPGMVVRQTDQPRSYDIETSSGMVRRNRSHLQDRPGSAAAPSIELQPAALPVAKPVVEHPANTMPIPRPNRQSTRSGRVSKPPTRLNL